MERKLVAMDGNSAAAHSAHATNEVIAIYPITPSSGMGEISDAKTARGEKNIWGSVPSVTEMQSEGGAAGAVHGALTAGALTTTFTASQGLLLMIPNMFKIAGELTPTVFHVTARTISTHALSIFGDHSDVMACRSTGYAMLVSANPQEVMDMALIAQSSTLEARVPFIHFFDGFRTSHELNMVEPVSFDHMREMVSDEMVAAHKKRALNPERPSMKGTAQNPDVFFQGREACNNFYTAIPGIVTKAMDKFASLTGRRYHIFDYYGAKDATNVVVVMASGADVVQATVENLLAGANNSVGVLVVRLYRPFADADFIKALPATVKVITALDRTKEPGAQGEPLYQDICAALSKHGKSGIRVLGGRYGLSSREFTPCMAKAVFENAVSADPKNGFTVGINDDVTHLSLSYDSCWNIEKDSTFRALFFGLGSDGTVGANKNTMKIISEETENYSQGYFEYDSKKAGSKTVSHIRFGKEIIRAPYLITSANFIGVHQFSFLEKYDMLGKAAQNAVVLINTPFDPAETWANMPVEAQKQIVEKKLKVYAINASEIARETGMGSRVNVIMQTAFFAISGVLPKDEAIAAIKRAIKKTYSRKGENVVKMNYDAVDATVGKIAEVKVGAADSKNHVRPSVPAHSPEFVKEVTGEIVAGRGEDLPVSKMPVDGSFPTGTSQYEKRNIALECPSWDAETCIQCGICSLVCPHAAIRIKAYDGAELAKAPRGFKSADGKADLKGHKVTVQVAVEDCTGCGACVFNCPAKNKTDATKKAINMAAQIPMRETEIANFGFFLGLKDAATAVKRASIKGSQLQKPLFEFSGACAGCGETPYIKLLTQLHGDHLAIANATGCSSIYGGNLPTTPYTTRDDGKGPVWSNSLFEDNAEFGLGMKLAYEKLYIEAVEQMDALAATVLKGKETLVAEIKSANQKDGAELEKQRARITELNKTLAASSDAGAKRLLSMSDYLIYKSVWILGGDGWAYDIGYGGLDHVLASGKNVKILVLDTEVYSNTGGQMSKSTPLGAVAAFAAGGKRMPKKDLGMIAMTYGNIYVAQIALGANYNQAVQALAEAEAYDGPALIIAYSHCIAHGIEMGSGMNEQKKAVQSGRWPLFRFNPALRAEGRNPLKLDSGEATIKLEDFMMGENRFRSLKTIDPVAAAQLLKQAEAEYKWRLSVYKQLAAMNCEVPQPEKEAAAV
ncbi:MAG: pyruvate:ferredoxin (flavodoxin) oxidoreductase [Elusimicrobiaceae bacterium]|nr:pyruvate:ferredoxin (flavodoxin) oxidoreductase [Elusimicrobiaceae bacterium]